MKKFFTIIGLLGTSYLSQGQRLLTEDFNYPVGQLTSGNLGTGANVSGGNWVWFSGTANFLQVTAGDLTYPNYNTSPAANSNKVTLLGSTASNEDAYRVFATQTAPLVGASTVYASFILNVKDVATLGDATTTGEFFAAFVTSTGITGAGTATYNAGRLYIRKGLAANTYSLGVSPNAPGGTTPTPLVFAPTEYAVNISHVVTLAYTFAAGANNDTAKLFIDAPYSNTEPVPNALSVAVAGTEPADINRLVLREGNTGAITTPNADIDALKISTTFYDAALPLNLLSFKGSLSDKGVQLNWTSANEQNVNGYAIERSNDGRSFTSIGNVDANNRAQNAYTFTDKNPLVGAGYYRLKSTDKDGAIKYSAVISINNRKGISAQIFPNPAKDNITIKHSKAGAEAAIRIVNTAGQQIKSYTVEDGAIQTSLLIDKLQTGTYLLIYQNGGEKTVSKLFKK